MVMQRRFAILGHRAPSTGRLELNDLPGGCGRMDVLCRAVNSSLFLSHGIRTDSHITLHLLAGPGPPRRIWFDGSRLRGLHVDERSIAGRISAILELPAPPAGMMQETSPGIWHDSGELRTTIEEWRKEGVRLMMLHADADPLEVNHAGFEHDDQSNLGFFLSDDRPFTSQEDILLRHVCTVRSLGEEWLQGHIAIGIVHHILDSIS